MSLVPSVSLLCGRQTESGVANFCFIYPSTPMSFCATRLGTMQQTYLSEYVNFVWQDSVSLQSKHVENQGCWGPSFHLQAWRCFLTLQLRNCSSDTHANHPFWWCMWVFLCPFTAITQHDLKSCTWVLANRHNKQTLALSQTFFCTSVGSVGFSQ